MLFRSYEEAASYTRTLTYAPGAASGVTGMPSPLTVSDTTTAANSTFTLASAPSRTGYTFAGWDIGGTTYAAGATYTTSAESSTATAKWTQITNDVTVNLLKDGKAYVSSGQSVWLKKDGSYTSLGAVNAATGSVTKTGVAPGTYEVCVGTSGNGTPTGVNVTVSSTAGTAATAHVNYYTVSFDLSGAPELGRAHV